MKQLKEARLFYHESSNQKKSAAPQNKFQQSAPCSNIANDKSEFEHGDEANEESIIRLEVISKAKTRLQKKVVAKINWN